MLLTPPIPLSCSCGTSVFFFCILSITNHSHSRDAASRALFWFNVLLKDTSTYRIRASGIKLYWCQSGRCAPWPPATVKLLILLSVWFQCWPSISQVVLLFPVPGPTWFHRVPPGPIWSHLVPLVCSIRFALKYVTTVETRHYSHTHEPAMVWPPVSEWVWEGECRLLK